MRTKNKSFGQGYPRKYLEYLERSRLAKGECNVFLVCHYLYGLVCEIFLFEFRNQFA